jgi:hypothetical protein
MVEKEVVRCSEQRMKAKRYGSRSESRWDLACTVPSCFICAADDTV